MTNERAVLWMSVIILMILGLTLGQAAPVMIAAAVGAYLVYEKIKPSRDDRPTTA